MYGREEAVKGIVLVHGKSYIRIIDSDFICATLDWWPPQKCVYGKCSCVTLLCSIWMRYQYFGVNFQEELIEKFEEAKGRSAGEVSIADLSGVLKLKKELCTAQALNESHVPDALLERLHKYA
ncbi:hypothetical protein Fmac_032344 [Flemingia macrophylla]|uniref:Uncharacterized protein n=1 Tax=Flemingia macrophylla TaxID=520843 RepID=A0ABD1L526_9FABA